MNITKLDLAYLEREAKEQLESEKRRAAYVRDFECSHTTASNLYICPYKHDRVPVYCTTISHGDIEKERAKKCIICNLKSIECNREEIKLHEGIIKSIIGIER